MVKFKIDKNKLVIEDKPNYPLHVVDRKYILESRIPTGRWMIRLLKISLEPLKEEVLLLRQETSWARKFQWRIRDLKTMSDSNGNIVQKSKTVWQLNELE